MNAVITGASRGIGKAVASIFALHGYDLYLSSRNEKRLLKTIDELKGQFPHISIDGIASDLGNKKEAQLFGQWVLNKASGIDVLVNNAGNFVPGNVSDEPDGALESMIEVNLYSAYHLTRTLLPSMMAAKRGHIFSICSIASLAAYPNGGSYSISKYALLGMTKNLRQELKPFGIKVTAVLPGAVYTDSWKSSGIEEQRIMKVEDIASMIYSTTLLSPQAVVEELIIRPQLGDL